ncbi:MAG: hypothetical protein EZS28_052793, partial [Streblomastix strix]
LPTHSESAMCQRILKIVQAKGIDEQARIIEAQYSGQALQGKISGCNVLTIAQQLKISTILAQEYVNSAEMKGIITRDQYEEEIYYWDNIFIGSGKMD